MGVGPDQDRPPPWIAPYVRIVSVLAAIAAIASIFISNQKDTFALANLLLPVSVVLVSAAAFGAASAARRHLVLLTFQRNQTSARTKWTTPKQEQSSLSKREKMRRKCLSLLMQHSTRWRSR